jgi:hypothetical protein
MTSNESPDSVGIADIGAGAKERGGEDLATEGKSWRSLIEASSNRSRKIRGSNYVQIATVEPKTNQPRCRTVVFRGFLKLPEGHSCSNSCDDLSCIMKMITDDRSQKVPQVMGHANQAAELVWWFPKTSEQYRVRGKLLFVGDGKFPLDSDRDLMIARKEQWGNLSDAAREAFFDQKVPGEAYSGELSAVPIPQGGRDEEGKVLPPPHNFLLMLLIPNNVDYLRLTNQYRQVDEQTGDGMWSSQRVNA